MPKAPTSKAAKHPLIDASVHFKDADGCVERQAAVLAVIPSGSTATGNLVLLQFFDWFMGEPSTRRLIPLSELESSERWVLYASVDEMNEHYERVDAKHAEAVDRRKERGDGPEKPLEIIRASDLQGKPVPPRRPKTTDA
jgi:hypothetical protein